MRRTAKGQALTAMVFVLWTASVYSQIAIVEWEKPITAKFLAGIVEFEHGAGPVAGALVEDCTPGWKTVIASTTTGKDGHFAFGKVDDRKTHYLQVSFRGANTLRVRVNLSRRAKNNLVLTMELST
jgi:hypothetical protein